MRARIEITGKHPEVGASDWLDVGPAELVAWNNHPDTTQAMVAQRLREKAFEENP